MTVKDVTVSQLYLSSGLTLSTRIITLQLLASYLENSAANSTLVYLIQEMICYALPSCKARHYVAACLINFRDVTLRDLILKSLLAQEKLTLKRALELRMTLAGVIEMADVENPFTFIGAMSNR